MNALPSIVFRSILRWLSLPALIAFSVPVHAVLFTFNSHWDGDWNLATGSINGNFFVDTLPFPMLTVVGDVNTSSGTYFGSGGDSIRFTSFGDGPSGVPGFYELIRHSGTFHIDGGTGHYAGIVGSGRYFGYSILDPNDSNIRKFSIFQAGEVNAIPEPSTNALLLAGAAILALALRARRNAESEAAFLDDRLLG